jgi:hypothetical protein
MAKPPGRLPPQKRKSDLRASEALASRAFVPNKRDPRQAGNVRRAATGVHPPAARNTADGSAGKRPVVAGTEIRRIVARAISNGISARCGLTGGRSLRSKTASYDEWE